MRIGTQTRRAIETLCREAHEAGDLRQAMICDLALGGPEALQQPEPEPGSEAWLLLEEGRTQEWAVEECQRVIAEGQG